MARPTTISDEQILEAARAVFLEEGVNASTATIARRAGVSEGTIFKRFATKEALFFTALGVPPPPAWLLALEATAGQGEVVENVARIAEQLIDYLKQVIPRLMLLWSSRTFPKDMMPKFDELPRVKALRALTAFFNREMELGRIRQGDPEIYARMLMGTLFEFVSSAVMGLASSRGPTPAAFSRGLARTLWEGIAPLPARKLHPR